MREENALISQAVHIDTDSVDCEVDFLRFGTFSRCPIILSVPQVEWNIYFAAELFSFDVYCNTAHHRQVSARFLAVFLHVECYSKLRKPLNKKFIRKKCAFTTK